MTLWLRGALRQWQRHRFGTFLLVAAHALGIAVATLVYAGIAAAEAREREVVMGDPLRTVHLHISAPSSDGSLAVDLDSWLSGVEIGSARLFFDGKGGDLDPALQDISVVALTGAGPMDWHPPLRSGRFLTDAEIAAGARIAVMGEQLPSALPGYTVVGTVADQSYNRSWDRRVYVPLASLPASFRTTDGSMGIHIAVKPGQDLARAKEQIEANLRSALPPHASATAATVQDGLRSTAHRFQRAFATGFGLSGLLLTFIASNIGVLTVHWLLQRRRELGVRLALGATRSQLAAMIAFEHVCLGLAGALAAAPILALAVYGAAGVGLPMELSLQTLGVAGLASVGSGLLSCLWPLAMLLRAPLVESLHLQD